MAKYALHDTHEIRLVMSTDDYNQVLANLQDGWVAVEVPDTFRMVRTVRVDGVIGVVPVGINEILGGEVNV